MRVTSPSRGIIIRWFEVLGGRETCGRRWYGGIKCASLSETGRQIFSVGALISRLEHRAMGARVLSLLPTDCTGGAEAV